METRFCGMSGAGNELFQAYNKLNSSALHLGKITGVDRGRLIVRLNDAPDSLSTYVCAKSIEGVSFVGIEELLDKEFVFSCTAYHDYEKTIELDSSNPSGSLPFRIEGSDEFGERYSLQKYVDEIVESKRRDFLYSLKVGDIYYGLVSAIDGLEEYFEANLDYDLKVRVIHLEVADGNRFESIRKYVRIGERVPLKLMKFNAMTGEPYFSLKAARATES